MYLNNILIYSNDILQHQKHVKEVLKWLCKVGLYTKAGKYEFYLDLVEYLGYILSPDSLTMSNAKVKNIQEWPEPKKIKNIQLFFSFTNFYRHFIYNYSNIVMPLTHFTRKNTPWKFDDKCQKAFKSLKKSFISAPILIHWLLNAQLIVETNSLDYTLAAILSIITDNNEVYPVAFHSQTFSTPKLNYNVHDKELLVIFKAFWIWWHYLERSALLIDIATDHKNLEYFSTTKILIYWQAKWLEYFSQFNLVI